MLLELLEKLLSEVKSGQYLRKALYASCVID